MVKNVLKAIVDLEVYRSQKDKCNVQPAIVMKLIILYYLIYILYKLYENIMISYWKKLVKNYNINHLNWAETKTNSAHFNKKYLF